MDFRDSSAASNSSANPSADEEGAHFSAIAKEAALLFQSRKYSECLELLRQLSQKKEHDPKQQSANPVAKLTSVPGNSSVAENSDLGSSAGLNTSDNSFARTLSDETLDYESMMSALDIGGNNLGSLQALSPSNNFSKSVFKLAVDECKDVVLPLDDRVLFTGNILCELC